MVDSTDTDDTNEDNDEHGESEVVRPQIDERTYLILAQRYKELFDGNSDRGSDPDDDVNDNPEAPYELDGYLTEIDTGLIDTDYMNANFDKWLKALKENSPELAEMSAQLHGPLPRSRGMNNDSLNCSCMTWSVATWRSKPV